MYLIQKGFMQRQKNQYNHSNNQRKPNQNQTRYYDNRNWNNPNQNNNKYQGTNQSYQRFQQLGNSKEYPYQDTNYQDTYYQSNKGQRQNYHNNFMEQGSFHRPQHSYQQSQYRQQISYNKNFYPRDYDRRESYLGPEQHYQQQQFIEQRQPRRNTNTGGYSGFQNQHLPHQMPSRTYDQKRPDNQQNFYGNRKQQENQNFRQNNYFKDKNQNFDNRNYQDNQRFSNYRFSEPQQNQQVVMEGTRQQHIFIPDDAKSAQRLDKIQSAPSNAMNLSRPINISNGTKIPNGTDCENPLFTPAQYQPKRIEGFLIQGWQQINKMSYGAFLGAQNKMKQAIIKKLLNGEYNN